MLEERGVGLEVVLEWAAGGEMCWTGGYAGVGDQSRENEQS